jgi:hypothetical protein
MYSAYYSIIKGHDPLISRRKESYATNTTRLEPMAHVEQLEQTQYPIRVPTFGLEQFLLVPRGVLV